MKAWAMACPPLYHNRAWRTPNPSLCSLFFVSPSVIETLFYSYGFEFDNKTANGTFARLAPMSPGGSDSRLAIFKFESFFNPGSTAKLKLSVNKKSKGTWVPLRSLSQSEQGIWAVYTINENEIVVRDFVDIIYFEDEYAFVNGTLQDGDLIVLGGASKIIEGKKVN